MGIHKSCVCCYHTDSRRCKFLFPFVVVKKTPPPLNHFFIFWIDPRKCFGAWYTNLCITVGRTCLLLFEREGDKPYRHGQQVTHVLCVTHAHAHALAKSPLSFHHPPLSILVLTLGSLGLSTVTLMCVHLFMCICTIIVNAELPAMSCSLVFCYNIQKNRGKGTQWATMPLVTSGSIGAKKAEAILRRHATSGLAGLTAFTNRQRNERLERFLQQQEAMGQWEASCAALADASLHNVPVHEENVLSAMRCCGLAGRSKAVQTLFYKGYKHLKLTKTTSSEIAFMDACAASGDFAAAHERMTFLIKRDERPPRTPPPAAQPSPPASQLPSASNSSEKTLAQWSPKLSTDVLVAYLTAAQQSERPVKLSAPAEDSSSAASRPGVGPTELVAVAPWSAALTMFVRLRANPATRPRTELTPLVLQQLSELADRGGQWEAAVKVVTGASAMHCLVPPESYDAAIRAAYRTKQHHHIVVRLVERCLATRTPPSEQSVRMALRSTEEVAASQAQDALTSTIPLMAGFLADASTDSAAATPSVPAAWALSLRLYQGLKDNGLALLPQTFEVPIRACCLSGKWDAAAKILGDMKVTFGRRVPQHAYRVVLLSKIEHAPSYDVAKRLSLIPVINQTSGAKYIAMLRCCARLGDWKHFKVIRNEMKQLEIPESYETIKLQMLLALADNNPHAVATRYVRWMQLTGFERDRVVTDATVPLHEDDFAIDGATLRLVVSACERLMKVDKEAQKLRATGEGKGGGVGRTLDPVVAVAHADALKRLSGGKDLLQGAVSPSSSVLSAEGGALPSWLFRNQPEED